MMKKVDWTDDLSIGIEVIDEQHRMLIKHLNDLTKAIEEFHGPEKIGDSLGFLIDYTDCHFSSEERHMAAQKYPALEAHKILHKEFKATLDDIERDFREEGATHELAIAIDTLLINWLLKHISKVDVEFADFLKSRNITLVNEE